MKLLILGNFNEKAVMEKYGFESKDTYIIADKARRMVYKRNKTPNVYYINDINDLDEYKRVLGEINLKFDKVIMNPPYERNLHLKVLDEVLKNISESGEVVNLSPVRWLQDPLAKEKKYSDFIRFSDIRNYINSIDIIGGDKAQKLFDAGVWSDLGIYNLTYKNNKVFDQPAGMSNESKSFIDKVILGYKDNMASHYILPKDCSFKKPFIKVSVLHGHKGNKDFYDYTSRNIDYSLNKTIISSGMRIFEFNTDDEALNFWNSLQSYFIRYIQYLIKTDMNVQWGYTPFMPDYTQPWTNERFCNYFGITGFISDTEAEPGSEWETILNTMKEYD